MAKNEILLEETVPERQIPLIHLENSLSLKPIYRVEGRKESLMISKSFVDRLDDQLQLIKYQKNKKRG